jgi:hypothetical protein
MSSTMELVSAVDRLKDIRKLKAGKPYYTVVENFLL